MPNLTDQLALQRLEAMQHSTIPKTINILEAFPPKKKFSEVFFTSAERYTLAWFRLHVMLRLFFFFAVST